MSAPLPGHTRNIHSSDACPCQYDECSAMATHEYCVAADSMGAEWLPLCQAHLEAFEADVARQGDTIDTCEWCKAPDVAVFPFRDWEEGNNGPVYEVCNDCIKKSHKAAQEELDRYQDQQEDEEEEETRLANMPDMEDDDILNMFGDEGEDDPIMLDNVTPLTAVDMQFNVTGPQLNSHNADLIHFDAYWQDGCHVDFTVHLKEGKLMWSVIRTNNWTIHMWRLAEAVRRIRSWGYPVVSVSSYDTVGNPEVLTTPEA